MEFVSNNIGSSAYDSSGAGQGEEDVDIRKGPWTAEEDQLLYNYISMYGDGRWNSLARCAGLKRTGKSCRLRWFNYLRPDVKRGNITLQEQLLILQLHTRWGNRWSKIAQYLPGRTDNEIKNYWRTRVQKQAKQLKCDVNSQQFRDTMRCVWIPRLAEQIRAESESSESSSSAEHRQVDLLINGGGGAQMVPDVDPTRYYKSHASVSATSSDIMTATTHVCADDMGLPDQCNIRACGPEMMGSSGGYGADQGMEQTRSCWVGVGGGGGGGRDSIKNNHSWIDEDIYDELDVWLGIQ